MSQSDEEMVLEIDVLSEHTPRTPRAETKERVAQLHVVDLQVCGDASPRDSQLGDVSLAPGDSQLFPSDGLSCLVVI